MLADCIDMTLRCERKYGQFYELVGWFSLLQTDLESTPGKDWDRYCEIVSPSFSNVTQY